MVRLGQNPFVHRHHRADLSRVTVTRAACWAIGAAFPQSNNLTTAEDTAATTCSPAVLGAGAEQHLDAGAATTLCTGVYSFGRRILLSRGTSGAVGNLCFREYLRTKLLSQGGCRALPGSLHECALTDIRECAHVFRRSCFKVCTLARAKSHMSR